MSRSSYTLPNPYGVGSTDYQAGINFERMRSERLRKAQDALKRHDMAAALFVRPENLRYTVAVKGHAFCPQLSYALVFAEHDPVLYELGDMVEHTRKCIVHGSSRRTSASPIPGLIPSVAGGK